MNLMIVINCKENDKYINVIVRWACTRVCVLCVCEYYCDDVRVPTGENHNHLTCR